MKLRCRPWTARSSSTPAEGTQSGTKFRLRGQGIQYLNGRGRGDQYVIVDVEIPKKLNRTQREALKAFEDSLKDENYEKRKGFFKNLKDRFMLKVLKQPSPRNVENIAGAGFCLC